MKKKNPLPPCSQTAHCSQLQRHFCNQMLCTPAVSIRLLAPQLPEGRFQHSCHLGRGKRSVLIGEQRMNDQNTEVKQENNEARWQREVKAAQAGPGVDCPPATPWQLPSPQDFSQHFLFSGPVVSVKLAPPYSSQSYLGEHASINQTHHEPKTFSKRNKWGLTKSSTPRQRSW